MADQLEGVKVGDRIRCMVRYGRREELFTVSGLTKTLAKCEGGASFRIDSGLMTGTGGGAGWNRRNGYLVDGEALARIELSIRIGKAQAGLRVLVATEENLAVVEKLLKASMP